MSDFRLSELEIKDVKLGILPVNAIYFREQKTWPNDTWETKYLQFEAIEDGTFGYNSTWMDTGSTDRAYYSLDSGATWTQLESGATTPTVTAGNTIWWKANMSYIPSSTSRASIVFSGTSEFNVQGNIMSLAEGDNFIGKKDLTGKNNIFSQLFKEMPVVSAENLVLPATTLSDKCYYGLFYTCSGLTTAPKELPAETLPLRAYADMFYSCKALTTAPDIKAVTQVGSGCCMDMFYRCYSLTTPPKIDRLTTVSYRGCNAMFFECTGLTNAPNLTATTIGEGAYMSMFSDCTSLTGVPFTLDVSDVPTSAYTSMFANCLSLLNAPEIKASTIGTSACRSMFSYCWSLTTTAKMNNLTSVGASGCTQMYDYCSGLTTAQDLKATSVGNCGYYNMFSSCGHLTSAPKISATTVGTSGFSRMFFYCSAITSVQASLPATTIGAFGYKAMFADCKGLTTAPELPATGFGGNGSYSFMFSGCTSLTKAPDILPALTLKQDCYTSMFKGCSGLTSAPELPAETLVSNCYRQMFSGCTNLNYIKMLATDVSATNCMGGWVTNVSSSGIFVKNPDATWTTTGTSGVPSSWTIPIAWLYLSDGDMKYITVPSNTATASTTITSAMTSAQTSTSFSVSKVLVTNLCNGLEQNAFNPYVGAGTPYYTTTEYDLMHSKIVWVGDGCFCTTNCPTLEFPDTLIFVGGGGLASKNLRELKFHSTTQPIMTSEWSDPPLVLDIRDGENYIRSGGVVKYPSGVDYGAWTYYTGLYGWTSQTI